MTRRFEIYNVFTKNSNLPVLRKHLRISRNTLLLLSSRNLNISQNKLYIWNLEITHFKMIYDILCSKSLKFFRTSKHGLNSDYFAKIAHKIAKSKYFPNILNDSDSQINSLSDDISFVWGNLSHSKIICGGTPHPPHPFILQNCVKSDEQILYKFSRFNELSIKRNIFIVPSP